MTRLLITGTSHVAALKAAWEAMADRPAGLEVDFLATSEKDFVQFTMAPDGRFGLLDESRATPDQVKLAHKFNAITVRHLGDYSHVLIAGCYFGYTVLLQLLAGHRVDLLRETPAHLPRLSQAAYGAFSHALAWAKYPASRVRDFAPWCQVALAASPRFGESILTVPDAEPYIKALAADPSGLREALAFTDANLDRAIRAEGARLFRVPDSSLTASGFTQDIYLRGGMRIQDGMTPDKAHMNTDYAALVLAPVLDWAMAG